MERCLFLDLAGFLWNLRCKKVKEKKAINLT